MVKKVDIRAQILRILEEKPEVNIAELAKATGLSKDDSTERRAIARAFKSLVDSGVIKAKGAARSRVYVSTRDNIQVTETPNVNPFKNISLSTKSKKLADYVSQSIEARSPVGYNQIFLRDYCPNKTFYLSKAQRSELLSVGSSGEQTSLAGTYARTILNRLLIDISWNSSRLEGNTYSLLETKRLIELGESAVGKDATETQMILNHKDAIEYIVDIAEEKNISSRNIRSIHALLSENLLGDPGASGRLRNIAVGVGGTTYIPLENPHLLQECFDIFVDKLNQIEDPFEQSFFSIVHLSYMQAFEDVNKRTARLVANIPLIKNNLRPLSFFDIDPQAYVKSLLGVYEENDVSLLRDLYIWAYKRASQKYSAIQQSFGGPDPLKMKNRSLIQNIIQAVILEKTPSFQVVKKIQYLLEAQELSVGDREDLFKLIELELANLHDGNIARYKISHGQFEEWQKNSAK